jgi:hypothetical protein
MEARRIGLTSRHIPILLVCMYIKHTISTLIDIYQWFIRTSGEKLQERATQRGRVLTSSVGLWEGPLGLRVTQCPYLEKLQLLKLLVYMQVPYNKIIALTPFFAKLTAQQTNNLSKLTNALSPSGIFLSIRLLDKFGFALNRLGAIVGLKMEVFDTLTGSNRSDMEEQSDYSPRGDAGHQSGDPGVPLPLPLQMVSGQGLSPSTGGLTVSIGAPEPYKGAIYQKIHDRYGKSEDLAKPEGDWWGN